MKQAAGAFGADPETLHLVNAGVNTVYRAGDLALRLCHEAAKNRDYLTPPIDWLRHLHAHGATVCEPLSTPDGEWIVTLAERHSVFLATAVRWVPGPRLSDLPPTPDLYREYGRSIGRLRRAAQGFVPAPGARHMMEPGTPGVFPRWDWLWGRAARHALGTPVLARTFERLTPLVSEWAAEELVPTHGDLRPGNVIWSAAGQAVVIDFDEPVLGPAALDLARAVMDTPEDQWPTLTAALLEGYRQEYTLAPVWDERLPTLRAMRAALMTAWTLEDGPLPSAPESGSGAAVSAPRLLEWLERNGD